MLIEPDEDTCNLGAGKLAAALTPDVKAVLAVHLYGQLADMPAIAQLCRERGLLLLEDAAQAHGAKLLVGLGQEFRRLHRRHRRLEPEPDAARGMDRDLLAHDRAHQPAEPRRHLAPNGMAHVLQHACEIGIDARQMAHRFLQVGIIEDDLAHAPGIARRARPL